MTFVTSVDLTEPQLTNLTLPLVILVSPYGPLGEYLAFHLTISHVVLPMGFEIWYFYWFSYQPDDR